LDFSIKEKEFKREHVFDQKDFDLAENLSKKLKEELKELLKGVVFFGSGARGNPVKGSDIDVLVILNDLKFIFSEEVITSIRLIIENVSASIDGNFHITNMKLSQFWEYLRDGDPILVNILREGIAVYDEGFFQPAQYLLQTGQIRPSKEAVWSYYSRAPKTLKSAEKKMLSTIVDMYWAVIDSAHAVLMHIDEVPPAPHQVADMLEKHFVDTNILEKKYLSIIRKFYGLAKDIGHEKLLEVNGERIDNLLIEADDFVKRMKLILQMDKSKLKSHGKRI
jgi:predicted nucleotidyltransferase/uncharacterized protein (UPF0332 family)